MTTLYLIRHAEAEGNVYRRCHGQYDALLTHRAPAQLACLADRFAEVPLAAIYASDLYRARHTAKAIADRKGMRVRIRPELREINMGDWEDKPWAELPRIDPAHYADWQHHPGQCIVPGGESVIGAGERVFQTLRELAAAHDGQSIAVVSHGSAIRGCLCIALGLPAEQIGEIGWGDNTCTAKFEFSQDDCKAVYWNDASHLTEELSTFASIGWTNVKGAPSTMQLWFRPYAPESDQPLFLDFMQELHRNAYGTLSNFDADALAAQAAACAAVDPRAVTFGMLDDTPAALVYLNILEDAGPGCGMVGGFCIGSEYRGTGLSQQILGQAISVYRARGAEYLCARAAENNARAQGFYHKFAFENLGPVQNDCGKHFLMSKRIKVDSLSEEQHLFD